MIDATGFPGRPMKGVFFIFPNANGLPGLIDILQKLIAPMGHYSMMRDLPEDVIQNYIGPDLDTPSLANLSLASRGNQELLENELESRRFHADDTSIRTAVEHYLRDPTEATEVYGPIAIWDVSAGSSDGDSSSKFWDGNGSARVAGSNSRCPRPVHSTLFRP